jgi:hypothetical protein
MIQKGRNRDTAWFSMLDREWPLYNAAFQQWLAPENFDAYGQERLEHYGYGDRRDHPVGGEIEEEIATAAAVTHRAECDEHEHQEGRNAQGRAEQSRRH